MPARARRARSPSAAASVSRRSEPAAQSPTHSGGLSHLERNIILFVIYVEISINVVNGVASLVSPLASLAPLSRVPLPAAAGEVARWFGAVTMAFGGWLLARSLSSPPALRLVLEALCVGDVLYLGALAPFTRDYGQLPGIAAPYVLTIIMFAARLWWLLREDWAAAAAAAARK